MYQSQTIQRVTFLNAEMQHSFAAAHSSSLVIEMRLYKVPRPKCGDSNREFRPKIPQHTDFRSAASRFRRSVWRRAHLTGGSYSKSTECKSRFRSTSSQISFWMVRPSCLAQRQNG